MVPDLTREQKASMLSGAEFWSTKSLDDAGIPSVVLSDGPQGVRRQTGDADHVAGAPHALDNYCTSIKSAQAAEVRATEWLSNRQE
ncbi:hypothetical protein ACRB8A_19290 (plasmid) [Arthrobacter sp. G.S.26]|uniref:hypothetical protein n=1 Tax=Arthrobacter sp. G.S.26 TaxID=3433706 RepID=UPI003D78487C